LEELHCSNYSISAHESIGHVDNHSFADNQKWLSVLCIAQTPSKHAGMW